MTRDRRHDLAQAGAIDQLLVRETERAHALHALRQQFHLGLILGNFDLTNALKATVVIGEIADRMPQLHRGGREWDFSWMPAEAPHASRVHARRVSAHVVFLDHRDGGAAARQVQRRRAAMQTAADDDHVG